MVENCISLLVCIKHQHQSVVIAVVFPLADPWQNLSVLWLSFSPGCFGAVVKVVISQVLVLGSNESSSV